MCKTVDRHLSAAWRISSCLLLLSGPLTAVCHAQCTSPPTATISSIAPAAFFAGAGTQVTIIGSGFILPGDPNGCSTTLSITAGTEQVALSNVTVVSTTEMMAVVSPLATDPLEGATVSVNNPFVVLVRSAASESSADSSNSISADILPVPVIQYNGNTISGANATMPFAFVGQQIQLTTNTPSPEALSALPVPLTFPPANPPPGGSPPYQWQVSSANIGGYTVTPPSGLSTSSSAIAQATALTNPSLTTYWLPSGGGNHTGPITYQYCITLPSPGTRCSVPVQAKFTIAQPTDVSANIFDESFTHSDYPALETMKWSISIEAQAVSPSNQSGTLQSGQYQWVQLISVDDVESFGAKQLTCTGGTTASTPALDTQYPYDTDLLMSDAPAFTFTSSAQTGMNVTENFETYLMWNPEVSTSIWVPLGLVRWSAVGDDAYNSSTGQYTIVSGSAPAGTFAVVGLSEPTWSQAVNGPSIQSSCH